MSFVKRANAQNLASRGSALLIVLGFLSFMVVSAVAFAIFMRSERMPSSAYHRTVATRHLVKAALAYAMSEIDEAICRDPFPGVLSDQSRYCKGKGVQGRYYDIWVGRVFMPPEPVGDDQDPDDIADKDGDENRDGSDGGRLVPSSRIDETVPVLTLESLGYLPPSLVNDVRWLARSSWSSKWHYFDFNAGRCAYVAVNVSDFFDINRTGVAGVRTSCPTSCVSLAYLMATGDSTDGSSNAKAFESKLTTARGAGSSGHPFVSMLDYNLAMGSSESPFTKYVGNGAALQKDPFYPGGQFDQISRQHFISDSFHTNRAGSSVVSLSNFKDAGNVKRGQPFSESVSMEGNAVMNNINAFKIVTGYSNTEKFKDLLSPLDAMALYDYLDRDDVPISLALPCCERTPMVVGVQPDLGAVKIQFEKTKDKQRREDGNVGHEETEVAIANSAIQAAKVDALIAFPFKRGKALNGNSYRVQAVMRLFLSEMRSDGTKGLRAAFSDATLRPSEKWFQNYNLTAGAEMDDHSILLFSSPQTVNFSSSVTEEDEALKKVSFTFTPSGLPYGDYPLLTEDVLYTLTRDESGNVTWTPQNRTTYKVGFHPLDNDFKALHTGELSAPPGGTYYLNCAVWLRIADANGNTVDLVPAILSDDKVFNDTDNTSGAATALLGAQGAVVEGTPMLLFSEGQNAGSAHAVSYSTDPSTGLPKYLSGQPVSDIYPKQMYTVDPRFNYAPENWYAANNFSESDWVDSTHDFMDGNGERDPDIFLFVSNQGYLQSMAEFAFLPRLGNMGDRSYNSLGATSSGYNGVLHGRDDIADAGLAWKTYHLYEMGGITDNLFNKGIAEGEGGVKVNPYTDNDEIFLAAIANTPYDWWVAGTNTSSQSSGDSQNAKDSQEKKKILSDLAESLKHAFCDKGDEGQWSYDETIKISSAIRNVFRSNPGKSIMQAWTSLPWYGDPDQPENFLGVRLNNSPMHSVDRKYLFGYWYNCLANNQQLFLVFVRAEPSSSGGASGGSTAQLGGRAVALVWRDPAPTGSETESRDSVRMMTPGRRPHPMRVLFYHQFD